jgi:hypothetical protein
MEYLGEEFPFSVIYNVTQVCMEQDKPRVWKLLDVLPTFYIIRCFDFSRY